MYLTYGSRTVNRTDSLYQKVNGLVGNIDWGESLTVAAYDFRGLNRLTTAFDTTKLKDRDLGYLLENLATEPKTRS